MTDANEVRRAAARVAGLYAHGGQPSPETEAEARRSLAVARIDREIRQALAASPTLMPAQTAHLVGLLVGWGGSDADATERLKRSVREAVYSTSNLTNADRTAIAKLILPGGDL